MDGKRSVDETFIIDLMTWSFSRLNSFYHCPYEWHEKYVNCQEDEDSFFSEFGSLCHSILEEYEKDELSFFELADVFKERFDEVIQHEAPPNQYVDLRESYFNKGYDYFLNIDLDLNNYEVLGVEKKVKFKIDGHDFTGFIDLLLREKATGKIIIVDHKSASMRILKDGSISKKDQKHFQDFKHQLYLYSVPILKEYGKVDELWWNMFKDQNWIKIPFSQDDYQEAIQWAKDTIELIRNTKDFQCNPDYYYCWYLCSQRNHACPYKPQLISKQKEETNNEEHYNPDMDYYR